MKAQIYLRNFLRGPGRENEKLNLDGEGFWKEMDNTKISVVGKLAGATNSEGGRLRCQG